MMTNMIKQLLSVLTLSTLSIGSASAVTHLYGDEYYANDVDGNTHYITYVRKDHEGDVQVKVIVNGRTTYYGINCNNDRISIAGDGFNGWDYVDHRKMEGYYSDVACRM